MNKKTCAMVAVIVLGISGVWAEEQNISTTTPDIAPVVNKSNESPGKDADNLKKTGDEKNKPKKRSNVKDPVPEYILKIRHPKEYEEIGKLKKSDPKEFKAQLEALGKKTLNEYNAEKDKVRAILVEYRKNKDESVLEPVRTMISEKYLARLEFEKKMIAQQEDRLKKYPENLARMKAEIQHRIETKDEMVDSKLKEICRTYDLSWPM